MLGEENLDLEKTLSFETSVEYTFTQTYKPFNQNSLTYNDEIRILIGSRDVLPIPYLSYIYVKARVDNLKDHTFTRNALASLFSSITYELNGIVIEKNTDPTFVSNIQALLTTTQLDQDYRNSYGFVDENVYKQGLHEETGTIEFYIPLRFLLSIFNDYRNIFLNSTHQLILTRSSNDKNLFTRTLTSAASDAVVPDAKIILDEISWKVTQVNVSDASRLQLLNLIKKNHRITIPFRTWEHYAYPNISHGNKNLSWNIKTTNTLQKPRFIIFAFQVDRQVTFGKDITKFDHVDIESFKLFLNDLQYPYNTPRISMKENKKMFLYEMFANFVSNYYKTPFLYPSTTANDFFTNYPCIVIDCSKQKEILTTNTNINSINSLAAPLNIRVEFSFQENIPKHTYLHAVIVYDKIISYEAMTGYVKQVL